MSLLNMLFKRDKKETKKEKKCKSVPVRHCPRVAKVRSVVRCDGHH